MYCENERRGAHMWLRVWIAKATICHKIDGIIPRFDVFERYLVR